MLTLLIAFILIHHFDLGVGMYFLAAMLYAIGAAARVVNAKNNRPRSHPDD